MGFPPGQRDPGGQYYDGFIPEIIVVGIGWAGEHPKYDSLRTRDLTPTRAANVPHSGNGPNFLAFLKKEVIPLIESKYRTANNERTLIGSSMGGLFTLYALFHETSLFSRYVLTSPAIGWDNSSIYAAESTYAANNTQLPVKLFMGIGGYEGRSDFDKFVSHLKSRNYKGLNMSTMVFEGMGHSGSKPEGFARGLQAVFERPTIALDSRILDQYAGVYEPMPGLRVRIFGENGKLATLIPDNGKIIFDALSESDFHVSGQYLFLHFKRDASGNVTGFQMEMFEGGGFVKKEKN